MLYFFPSRYIDLPFYLFSFLSPPFFLFLFLFFLFFFFFPFPFSFFGVPFSFFGPPLVTPGRRGPQSPPGYAPVSLYDRCVPMNGVYVGVYMPCWECVLLLVNLKYFEWLVFICGYCFVCGCVAAAKYMKVLYNAFALLIALFVFFYEKGKINKANANYLFHVSYPFYVLYERKKISQPFWISK